MTKNTWNGAFGFQKIESFFSDIELQEIKKHVSKLALDKDRRDYVWKYYEKEDKEKLNRIEYFVNYNEELKALSLNEKIIKLVKIKLNDEPALFKDKVNFKYPGGEGFLPHQDIAAGWGEYCNKHVSVAIPLCDTDEENGCLFFGKKSRHMLTENFKDLDNDIFLEAAPSKAGDIFLFDSYVPHASYGNKSNFSRAILFFTYTPLSYGDFYEKYHSDKFINVPPDIYKVKGRKYRSGNSNSLEIEY